MSDLRSGIIVCVARNNLHLTKKAIASALAQDIPVEVFLVDNCSTDGTAQWARTKPVHQVCHWQQASLSECWNKILRVVWSHGYKHALVINNDIEMRPDTYKLLLQHGGPFITAVSVDSTEQMGEGLPTTERPHPDFSCFLIRKSVTDRVGFFDESYYPAYCEDNDYHVRMHRAGITAISIDLPFLHHGAQTVKNAEPGERAAIERGAERNRQRFKSTYGCYPGTKEYEDLFLPLPAHVLIG